MNELKQQEALELIELLDSKKYPAFIRAFNEWNPVDAAEFLTELPSTRLPMVFRLLKKDIAAEIFAELEPEQQTVIIEGMTDREIGIMLDDLFVDDAVDMLEEMPASIVKRIMQSATPETRAEINRFLAYPEDSAGSVMTSEFIDLKAEMTCQQAVAHIRKHGLDKETVYVAYVTDSARVLIGVVPLKSLLFADPEAKIRDVMNENVIFGYTHDDRETVANMVSHYGILALPIVDREKRLVGLVTVDDALEVLETEATEDIEKMAAILPSDKPYMRMGVWETYKKRIPWLLLLMVSATFTGAIISHYEAAIGTYAILTVFFPMLMDTGGNAGGQSSVTIIRGLSLGEIELRDVLRVLWKELRISAICGLTLAAAAFVKVMAIDFRFQLYTVLENGESQNNLLIAAVICATVFSAIVVAKTVGTLLPIGAKRIGLDPAVMASPFITTIVDTVVLIIYFSIASAVLPF
ncbi:MAG: magnesium transporter [Clostridia bacterium]|nr:magnesium transporter [Clostridia bacterium]